MPRADLHSALVCDLQIYQAAQVDPDLLDPVIRTVGSLPGPANPFVVARAYQGPQGTYSERFVVSDGDGSEVVQSQPRLIRLRGEMFEDQFLSTFRDVRLPSGGEYTATFFVDDIDVGTIPVFVESATGGDTRVASEETFKRAIKKGAILWVTVPQPEDLGLRAGRSDVTRPVWFVSEGDKLYVLTGPTEQHVPGLPDAAEVVITARSKDHRSKVSEVPAAVRVIPPEDDLWNRVMSAALTKRLNLHDGQDAADRWREHCVLVELAPRFKADRNGHEGSLVPGEVPVAAAAATAETPAAAPARQEDDIHVEAEVDQEVFDKLIAEGKPERVARARAKAAYVRKEKQRILQERQS